MMLEKGDIFAETVPYNYNYNHNYVYLSVMNMTSKVPDIATCFIKLYLVEISCFGNINFLSSPRQKSAIVVITQLA